MGRIFRHDPLNFDAMAPSLKGIIALTVGVFILQSLGGIFPSLDYHLVMWFGLIPARVLQWPAPEFWRLVTYLFLHGSIWHLLFNVLALWMFGMPVVAQWGDREFLKFFFLCGVGAALFHLAISSHSDLPVIGFSGSVYGMLVAFAMLYPDAVVYVWLVFPMRAAHMAILYGLIEFFAGATSATPGVARLAHLGGMVTGYLYIRWWWVLKIRAKGWFRGLLERGDEPPSARPARRQALSEKTTAPADDMTEVDRILDKIILSGKDSLTEDERSVLDRYSKRRRPS